MSDTPSKPSTTSDSSNLLTIIQGLIALLLLILVVQGFRMPFAWDAPVQYHAVQLTNGQTLYGRLSNFPSDHPVLKDASILVRTKDKQTGKIRQTFLPRLLEPHQPNQMVLNAEQIVFVEPVRAGSPADQYIATMKEKIRNAKSLSQGHTSSQQQGQHQGQHQDQQPEQPVQGSVELHTPTAE